MNTKMNLSKGGEVIASGGFGCVFSPALKCKRGKRKNHFISKLMTKKYALQEYDEITDIKEKLDSIPHYEDYFLIYNFHLCEPEKLDNTDLKNFEKKCSALPKDDITKKNINKNLDKVLALNMPYGGIPVDDFIYKNINFSHLIKLNNSLIQLLNEGILIMNQKHIYHGDIKDSNILVDIENNHNRNNMKTRLIDWGLSTTYVPFQENSFPKVWRNRPLQFNVPFSVILFSDDFVKKYTKYLEEGGTIDTSNLKPFIMDYIYFWLKTRGNGHYKYINHIMYMLFSHELNSIQDEKIKTRIIETEFTLFYISNYLTEILVHFTHFRENGTLNLRVYLDKVYIHLLDVYGWITCYLPLLEILFENYDQLNEKEVLLFNTLKQLFLEYLYKPRVQPIDISKLTQEFKNLDKICNLLIEQKKKTTSLKYSLGNEKKVTGFIPVLRSTKKRRTQIKKNRTKRNNYLLFAHIKKSKPKKNNINKMYK